jgi:two-component system response regulator FixJ
MPKATVFIVDDDPAVRQGLGALLEVNDYACEAFESGEHFLARAAPQPPGCVLLDVRMPGMSGLELQRELKRRGIELPVVIITGHGDIPMAVAALKAGAADFLEKPFDSDALLAAVEQCVSRAPPRGDTADELEARFAHLTPRERQVMNLVVAGLPNKAIGFRLNIAVRTVEIHRARVMEKTGVRNLAELVRFALQLPGNGPQE